MIYIEWKKMQLSISQGVMSMYEFDWGIWGISEVYLYMSQGDLRYIRLDCKVIWAKV